TGTPRLLRGVDHSKDQSYVLFGAPRARLNEMLLPIGGLEKTEVRAIAEELGLPVFDKPDSQEICFVPDNDYAGLVERRRTDLASHTGDILDPEGKVVGRHEGQHRFTIGQRRGVGVAFGYPIYVVDKDPEANTITVGEPELLLSSGCIVAEANWLVDEPPLGKWMRCLAQVRYNSEPVPARVRSIDPLELPESAPSPSGRTGAFEIAFDEPQRAVAPGQAAALYSGAEPDLVLGGGWIAKLTKSD
ncbi:MAG: MnmA/TRMU family protein, partial [Phycisphaerales bacterium]